MTKRLGVISDTHGLLRPEAITALAASDHIIHAGDIGKESIVKELELIAPVTAIRGNVDNEPWCFRYSLTEALEFEGIFIYVHHGHLGLDIDPKAGGFSLVISGHSHEPKIEEKNGVTFFNPGSAGRKRFSLPVSLGILELSEGKVEARLIYLDV